MGTRSEFLHTLLKESAPIFLASGDARGKRLTLHVVAGSNLEQLKARIRSALSQTSAKLRVSVRSHKLDRLAFPRSLEHWLRPFASEGVLYDPTMIAARARELLGAAQSCRVALRKSIDGIFCDPVSRNLLILARSGNIAELQSKLASTIAASAQWEGSIRVVSILPSQNLVPVDAQSARLFPRLGRFIRRWRAPAAVALAISAVSAVPASAHTNGGRLDLDRTTLSTNAAASEYGMLSKLSVFADGARLGVSDSFVSFGLKMYFGEKQQVAQNKQRSQRRCEDGRLVIRGGRCAEDELGQTGLPNSTGPGLTGSGIAGPSS